MLAAVLAPASPAEAAFAVPSQVRSIGGSGRAALFPWGVAHNPVTGELIVTDYLNYQVRRYSAAGEWTGDLPQPTGASGDPESVLASVAVDPRNGDVFVAKPKPDTLAHYSAAGERLADVVVDPGAGTQTYTAWLSIDAEGYIYVLDSHLWNTATQPSRLIKLAPGGGAQVAVWELTFPGQLATQAYGIDVASDGVVYLSDAINRRVQVLGPNGTWWRSIGTPGDAGTVGALGGDLRSVHVEDSTGRLYVVDALQSQIEVFALDGTPLFHFGTEGEGEHEMVGPRQLTGDGTGGLWVSEYGNYRLHHFDGDGNSLGTAPRPSPSPPPGQLGQPRDVAVDAATGDVWVVDTWNQRFQKFGADGTFAGAWGRRGNAPPYGVKYPRGIGFDEANRRVWVPNHAGGTIYVYDDQANFLFQLGSEDNRHNNQPGFFEKPHSVTFGNGYAYVTDTGGTYEGNSPRVKILDATSGAEVGSIPRTSKGVAVDAASGRVFVADSNQQKIFVYAATGGPALFSFGGRGSTDGKFTGLWGVTVANGVVYASDDAASRIQAFTTAGAFLGKWGGAGSGPHKFRNPSGLAHDAAGRLYVSDAQNDRVVVFDPATPKPTYEFSRPGLTVAAPAQGAWLDAPVTISGTATDNVAVASVEVSVRDNTSGLWWQPNTATWAAAQTWILVPWSGPTSTSVSWTWTFPGARYDRSYHVQARARDTKNTTTATVATRDFNVHENVPDSTVPTVTVESPPDGSVVALAPLDVTGSAADDVGVAAVRVGVRHAGSGQWWTGAGWSTDATYLDAALTDPGGTSTAWTWTWTPPAAGAYTVSAQASDLAGNTAPTGADTAVLVELGGPDTTPPDATVTFPVGSQVLPAGPVVFAGQATDNAGVAGVSVMVKNRDTGLYWKASSGQWVSAFTWNTGAALSTPAASPTGWTYAWTPPGPGNYALSVRAQDAAANTDPTRPWVNFSVA